MIQSVGYVSGGELVNDKAAAIGRAKAWEGIRRKQNRLGRFVDGIMVGIECLERWRVVIVRVRSGSWDGTRRAYW